MSGVDHEKRTSEHTATLEADPKYVYYAIVCICCGPEYTVSTVYHA